MDKIKIGIIFICAGLLYGSLAINKINEFTLGFLAKNGWIKIPKFSKSEKNFLGPKLQIIFYSAFLILIGIYMIWNRNI